jgi:hypothetical protein
VESKLYKIDTWTFFSDRATDFSEYSLVPVEASETLVHQTRETEE